MCDKLADTLTHLFRASKPSRLSLKQIRGDLLVARSQRDQLVSPSTVDSGQNSKIDAVFEPSGIKTIRPEHLSEMTWWIGDIDLNFFRLIASLPPLSLQV